MDELQKESNLKRYQYLPPRDRYRLQKQMKADEEAERIKSNILAQKHETSVKMARARERNDPYKSTIALGTEPVGDGRSKSFVATDVNLPSPHLQKDVLEEADDEELFDENDHQSVSVVSGKSQQHFNDTMKSRHFSADDSPASPRGNVPPGYGRSWSSNAADDEELLQMMDNLEDCLTNSTLLDDQTLVADDKAADAFGPVAKDMKIKNLRAEALKSLGQEKFEAVYNHLKKARFDDRKSGKDIDENRVMHDLRRICSDSNLCFIVEQLLFLETSDHS